MDREKIVKELNEIEDAIQSLEQEEENINQLETTDPDKAKKMMADLSDKLIELHNKQEKLYEKSKKRIASKILLVVSSILILHLLLLSLLVYDPALLPPFLEKYGAKCAEWIFKLTLAHLP
jgi:CHASE3 domain sensor protein